MKRILLICLSLIVAWTSVRILAWAQAPPAVSDSPFPDSPFPESAVPDSAVPGDPTPPAVSDAVKGISPEVDPVLINDVPAALPEAVLRKKYLEVLTQKVELMSPIELQKALESSEQDLTELRAARKLDMAKAILEEVVLEYASTPAGRRAKQMLSLSEVPHIPHAPHYLDGRPDFTAPGQPPHHSPRFHHVQPSEPVPRF